MALFKVFRGLSTELDAVARTDGHAYFCTDDGSFWIDYKDNNEVLQRKQVNDNKLTDLQNAINTKVIDAQATDDDVVILTGTDGTNAVIYDAKHAKKGPSAVYTSGNTVTSISGNGTTAKIKIPQLTVDIYGHVNAAADEEITITLPSAFEITANATDDDVVILTGTKGSNSVSYDAKHAEKGPASGYESGNTVTKIEGNGATGTIKIPQIKVDKYGHVNEASDEEIKITMPTLPTSFNITAEAADDNVVDLTAEGGANKVKYTASHAKKGPNGVGGSAGATANATADAAGETATIKVPHVTVDAYGHTTELSEKTYTVSIPESIKNPKSLTIGNQSYDGSAAITVTAADLGLTGALKLLGTTTTNIVDSSTTNPITVGGKTVTAELGNVVLYGNQEFMWNGTFWELLGDEGSYALKTVQVIAGNGLTGGGTLESNRTLNVGAGEGITVSDDAVAHAVPSGASSGAKGTNSAGNYVRTVTTDKFGHVTGVTSDTFDINDHYTPAADASAKLSVDAVNNSTNATFYLVSGVDINRDAKGHTTSVSVDSVSDVKITTSTDASGNKIVTFS